MRPARQRAVNLLVLLGSACIALAMLETAVRCFNLFELERSVFKESSVSEEEVVAPTSDKLVHPYRGWSKRPKSGEALRHTVNNLGYRSRIEDYREVDSSRFIVGLFGGSVADQTAIYGSVKLTEEVVRRFPELSDNVTILNLGAGAYKQPQQVIALVEAIMIGIEFDLIINIDGVNEARAAVNRGSNVHPVLPLWRFYNSQIDFLTGSPSVEALGKSLSIVKSKRSARRAKRLGAASGLHRSELAKSVLGMLVLRHQQDALEAEISLRDLQETGETPIFSLPNPCEDGRSWCWDLVTDIWSRGSRIMNAIAYQSGAQYIHVLQPNPYLEGLKPLSEEELKAVHPPQSNYARIFVDGYRHLRRRGEKMKSSGVLYYDLTAVFAEYPETIYVDSCCHYNPRGYEIFATAIGAVVPEPTQISLAEDDEKIRR